MTDSALCVLLPSRDGDADLPGQILSGLNGKPDGNQEVVCMLKKRYAPENIIHRLRMIELEIGSGLAVLYTCPDRDCGANVLPKEEKE